MQNFINVSVNAEAQPARAASDHLDRLIWGRFGGEEFGLSRMMDMADRHGVKLTVFVDYCEHHLYGEGLLDVAREVARRGHDAQVMARTDLLPPAFLSANQDKAWPALNRLDAAAAAALGGELVALAMQATGAAPLAFRGGAFRFNPAVIEEFGRLGFKLSANYHSGAKYWAKRRPHAKLFRWPNGVVELPVSTAHIGDVYNYLIFENFALDSESALRQICDALAALAGPVTVVSPVLHSWSLLTRDEDGRYVAPDVTKLAKLEAFFANIARLDLTSVVSADILKLADSFAVPTLSYAQVFDEAGKDESDFARVPASLEPRAMTPDTPTGADSHADGAGDANTARQDATAAAPASTPADPPAATDDVAALPASEPQELEPPAVDDEDAFWRRAAKLRTNAYIVAQAKALGPSGSSAALAALLRGEIPLTRDARATLAIAGLDWTNLTVTDRSQLWQVQHWIFVRDCLMEWHSKQTFNSLKTILPVLRSWCDANLAPDRLGRLEDLTWHDHATGLRAINFVYLLFIILESGGDIREELPQAYAFARAHVEMLSTDKFYSRGTNHGYDQAFALYFLCENFDDTDFMKQGAALGKRRLLDEIASAFTEESVHVENSPSYHPIMLGRLLQAAALFRAGGDVEAAERAEVIYDGGLEFLTHVMKPDGTLFQFGDSDVSPLSFDVRPGLSSPVAKSLRYAVTKGKDGEPPRARTRLFTKSGYAFFRNEWPSADKFKDAIALALKCGFFSTYHRHDDDCNVLLYGYGEDWLIDSGIYKYVETDPTRLYLRSPAAHNIVSVEGLAASRALKPGDRPSFFRNWGTREGVSRVLCRSLMYPGYIYDREVAFVQETGAFTLRDEIARKDGEAASFALRLHAPADKTVTFLSEKTIEIASKSSGWRLVLDIESEDIESVRIVKGQAPPEVVAGWTSPRIGQLEPAHEIVLAARPGPRFQCALSARFVKRTDAA